MLQVIVTPKAEKQFKHLPNSERLKIKKKLVVLADNPYSGKKLSGEFSELRSIRSWPYRIIYYISKEKIFVTSIMHRQGAYK